MFQNDAITRLLRDDDPATIALVTEQLLAHATENAPHLRALLARTDDAVVSGHVRSILAAIEAQQAEEEFALLCHFFAEDGDIEAAQWLLGRCLVPGLDVATPERLLDEWGAELRRRLSGAEDDPTRIRILAALLHGECDVRGNTADYYHPHNSLLARVVVTRLGIPISLTILYQLVARRAGLRVDGINLPGHFIGRLGEVLFDPFHGGRILSAADCTAILEKQALRPNASYLALASARQILVRTLANLHFIFQQGNREPERARVENWLKSLDRA